MTSQDQSKTIVGADGKPLRRDGRCPRCLADKSKRISHVGFGPKGDRELCSKCGYEFVEGKC